MRDHPQNSSQNPRGLGCPVLAAGQGLSSAGTGRLTAAGLPGGLAGSAGTAVSGARLAGGMALGAGSA
jgi:hypothetical protein